MRSLLLIAAFLAAPAIAAPPPRGVPAAQRPMSDLKATSVVKLGRTADWVVITADAVWVGSTGPDAVHRIDPKTGRVTDVVPLPGEPCAHMTAAFGALWAPVCGERPGLAKVDLAGRKLAAVFPMGVLSEGGVAAGGDSVWMVTDAAGTLARIDPATGRVRQTIATPPGSTNALFADRAVYVADSDGAAVTVIDGRSGRVKRTVATGPEPRFMAAGAGAVWTLNQGDGTVTRIDLKGTPTRTLAQGLPGHGGDIAVGANEVWTTLIRIPLTAMDPKTGVVRRQWVGPGGDSLAVGHGAVWLTDFGGGTLSRIPLAATR
jgi:DNA-binding beta-propeller fold protein YncE